MRSFLAIAVSLCLAGCATAGNVTPDQVAQVNPGMTSAQVLQVMGAPGARSFREQAEAWQYCRDTMFQDDYQTVWIVEGVVVSLTNQSLPPGGPCAGYYGMVAVDWGQAPPDVRIRIEQAGNPR